MTALSIINMRQSQRYHNELSSGAKLNKLEKLAVRLQVARSMQKQTAWQSVVTNGETMEMDVLSELLEICDTDPAHRAVSACAEIVTVTNWQTEAEAQAADFADLKMTEDCARF